MMKKCGGCARLSGKSETVENRGTFARPLSSAGGEEMDTEKRIWHYLFLIVIALTTGYTFLLRSAGYDESGKPKTAEIPMRIIGENMAGDYALFRLMEEGTKPQEAYRRENVSAFVADRMKVDGRFVSFANPVKAFLAVPFLTLPYSAFFDTFLLWGMFAFGAALYAMFPLRQSLLLMFAFPVAFLNFTLGGWGVFVTAFALLALALADEFPKRAGMFCALCLMEPIVFAGVLAAYVLRKQKKAAVSAVCFAAFLTLCALARYGAGAFGTAFGAAMRALTERPCSFSSVAGILMCGGMSAGAAVAVQTVIAVGVLCAACRLLVNGKCAPAVQDACLCGALCFVSPFFYLSDYALLYAGIAFLIKDSLHRGLLKGDGWLLAAAFASIYLEGIVAPRVGAPFQMILAAWLVFAAFRRRF